MFSVILELSPMRVGLLAEVRLALSVGHAQKIMYTFSNVKKTAYKNYIKHIKIICFAIMLYTFIQFLYQHVYPDMTGKNVPKHSQHICIHAVA